MKYIFLDTNIFLHFQEIENIDWLKESASDRCQLIIAPIIIDELDKFKTGTGGKSKKAKKALDLIESLSETENPTIRDDVFFQVLINKPSPDVYELNGLNFNEQDHRLFASIIKFQNEIGPSDIALCTDDIGPRIRAKHFNIKPLKLDEKYKLPAGVSEEQKKVKKLESELQKHLHRTPKLSISFSNDRQHLDISLEDEKQYARKRIDEQLEEIKKEHPLLEYGGIDPYNLNVLQLLGGKELSNEKIKRHNAKLKNFYMECRNALTKQFNFILKYHLTFDVKLKVHNSGKAPAEDIDVHFIFPKNIEVVKTADITPPPDLPSPPKSFQSYLESGLILPPVDYSELNANFKKPKGLDSVVINELIEGTEVVFHSSYLKHGYTKIFDSLSISFEKYSVINSFNILASISAANIPEGINEKLNVIFTKTES